MIRKLLIPLVLILIIAAAGFYFFSPGEEESGTMQAQAPAGTSAPAPASGKSSATAKGDYWTVRCDEEKEKHCEVFQRLVVKETNQRLVELAIGYPKESKGKAQAAIILPLGLLVSEGAGLLVDGENPVRTNIRTCGADGCLVVMDLPEAFMDAMKKGKVLTVAFIDAGTGKQVNVEMSLQDFAAKLNEVKA